MSTPPLLVRGPTRPQDGEGRVLGAQLRLGWDPDKAAFSSISRHLQEFGMSHHELATVEDFEVRIRGFVRSDMGERVEYPSAQF